MVIVMEIGNILMAMIIVMAMLVVMIPWAWQA